MTANFWELQRRAKQRTVVYLAIFALITIGMAFGVELALRYLAPQTYRPAFPIIGSGFLGVTFGVAAFQYMMYRSLGGSYVAESVGGKRISPDTRDWKERQLLHIAEEIGLASALPVPPIYILDASQINAFAAGLHQDRAAIAVTKGTLNKLSRQEIQGVVAHEFGHIYNGDMKISLQLAAMIMGFFFLLYLALRLVQIASFSGRGRNGKKGANPVLLAALLLLGAGAISWFAGSILKAMISRQREYLADACAVQFTRNPDGIANALKKIAKDANNDMPSKGMAYSHMYLDNHLGFNSLFATHPPLEKRIQAILGLQYLPPEWKKSLRENS